MNALVALSLLVTAQSAPAAQPAAGRSVTTTPSAARKAYASLTRAKKHLESCDAMGGAKNRALEAVERAMDELRPVLKIKKKKVTAKGVGQ